MKYFALLGLFALGCHAYCQNVTRYEDSLMAECMDEDSMMPFLYLNQDMKTDNADDTDIEYMGERLYARYAAYVAANTTQGDNGTSTDMSRRQDTTAPYVFWEACRDGLSGRCVAAFAASLLEKSSQVGSLISSTITAIRVSNMDVREGSQMKQGNACAMSEDLQICIATLIDALHDFRVALDNAQINAAANNCGQTCYTQDKACDVKTALPNGDTQVQCITGAMRECKDPGDIRRCDT